MADSRHITRRAAIVGCITSAAVLTTPAIAASITPSAKKPDNVHITAEIDRLRKENARMSKALTEILILRFEKLNPREQSVMIDYMEADIAARRG